MAIPDSNLWSLRQYADSRGLDPKAVARAVKVGRLRQSIAFRGGTPKVRDPELADREWADNTDWTKAPAYVKERPPPGPIKPIGTPAYRPSPLDVIEEDENEEPPSAREGMKLSEASAIEKVWKAKEAELKFRKAAADLIPVAAVESRLVEEATRCKTQLLGIPSRARQQLPHLSTGDIAVIEALIREALEELARS